METYDKKLHCSVREFGNFLFSQDSRHVQLTIYTVLHEESNFQVKQYRILEPEGKIRKNETRKIDVEIVFLFSFFGLMFSVFVVFFCFFALFDAE